MHARLLQTISFARNFIQKTEQYISVLFTVKHHIKRIVITIMSKINHLEMGKEVMSLKDIEVKKTFFGLSTKLIYKPTNSAVKVKEREYSSEDGRKLENILAAEPNNVEMMLQKFPVSAISMGNMKLQACVSEDHQFVAIQILGFKDFDYKPLTGVKVFEGKAAEAFAQLF